VTVTGTPDTTTKPNGLSASRWTHRILWYLMSITVFQVGPLLIPIAVQIIPIHILGSYFFGIHL
jgi:hypothetical protein